MRIDSGRFTRGMVVVHVRTGKSLNLNTSLQLKAQERTLIEEACPGDIVGLWDPGTLRIGDTLSEDTTVHFDGIASRASCASC